jgi:hypothetical protein
MYEAAKRFSRHTEQDCTLLYLGDHDPSGEDMVRDVTDRLRLMASTSVDVVKIALTPEQVSRHSLPPNPAKLSDSRFADYVSKHGDYCWEVDALRPEVLHDMVEQAILAHLDTDMMEAFKEQETADKLTLKAWASGK